MNTNGILRDGRKLRERELDFARELEKEGLCDIKDFNYVECVSTEDEDYDKLRDHDCDAQVEINEESNKQTCPKCRRTIYLDEKTIKSRHRLQVDTEGIRVFVRDICTEVVEDSATKRKNDLNYLDHDFHHVNVATYRGEKIELVIVSEILEKEILSAAKVDSKNLVFILADEAISLGNDIEDLKLQYTTVGDLMDSDNATEIIENKICAIINENREGSVSVAAQEAIEICSDRSVLEQMGWDTFEHCIQAMLDASFGTSHLFGGLERGSGEPDGVLTLHGKDDSLFMWDAKFVNLEKNEETDLSGEYDKIFRHLNRVRERERIQSDFDGVAGILLFTPGIKESNVSRLAETIHEREITAAKKWNGSIVYFELDAMLELTKSVLSNKSNVRQKTKLFMKAVHTNLTSPSKHEDDPDKVYSPDYNSLHMSVGDVNDIFDFIDGIDVEHTDFDADEYRKKAEYFEEI